LYRPPVQVSTALALRPSSSAACGDGLAAISSPRQGLNLKRRTVSRSTDGRGLTGDLRTGRNARVIPRVGLVRCRRATDFADHGTGHPKSAIRYGLGRRADHSAANPEIAKRRCSTVERRPPRFRRRLRGRGATTDARCLPALRPAAPGRSGRRVAGPCASAPRGPRPRYPGCGHWLHDMHRRGSHRPTDRCCAVRRRLAIPGGCSRSTTTKSATPAGPRGEWAVKRARAAQTGHRRLPCPRAGGFGTERHDLPVSAASTGHVVDHRRPIASRGPRQALADGPVKHPSASRSAGGAIPVRRSPASGIRC